VNIEFNHTFLKDHLKYMFSVGVTGSIFGVHTEDANLCSVNMLLHGAAKVWFFVPFSEQEKIEKYMRFN
jgi:hypothetical protein